MWPKKGIMVTPKHFDVTYAINPHMLDSSGSLQTIDKTTAFEQWSALVEGFRAQGVSIDIIEGQENLPDMVFSANQMFPFRKEGRVQFVMSRMRSSFRQQEIPFFEKWCHENNYEFYHIPEGLCFEAMGDAVWNYETDEIFCGYGFRTDRDVCPWLMNVTGKTVIPLELISEQFYHLDTACCILNKEVALVVAGAFSDESLDKLKMKFVNLIFVDPEEAKESLAANACSLDGRRVFVEDGAKKTQQTLRQLGFKVLPFCTSEYLKSGGSIFCLKLLY